MIPTSLETLVQKSLGSEPLNNRECRAILSGEYELLPLLDAAFKIRQKYFQRDVYIHILNNVQNGGCSQDCQYCAQSQTATAPIEKYSHKSDAEILAEAKAAYENKAFRHCLVFSGKGLSQARIEHLAGLVKQMKSKFKMEICVSPGFITADQAKILKQAGVDRINHNLNTSRRYYRTICSTHQYDDRLATIKIANKVGLTVCSGIIVGMGEQAQDIIAVALELKKQGVASIPINFLLPIPGIALKSPQDLTPEYCLRVLCLFRLLNPRTDIRIAAGREYHLRGLEVLALYPATSLFLKGYLNTRGSTAAATMQMINDAGFEVVSEGERERGVERETKKAKHATKQKKGILLKNREDLRQFLLCD